MNQDKKREGISTEIREGMTVYGLMLSRDGHFVAEGTVSRIDGSGFHVKYKILPTEMEYRYEDIGKKSIRIGMPHVMRRRLANTKKEKQKKRISRSRTQGLLGKFMVFIKNKSWEGAQK